MEEFKTYTKEDKIAYFKKRVDDETLSDEQRRYAKVKLESLLKGKDIDGYEMRKRHGFKKTED